MGVRTIRLRSVLLAAAVAVSIIAAQIPKRPLSHKDYASWRSIVTPRLSPDGRFVAYFLFPQEGDGHLVVKDLKTGSERRTDVGARPQPSARTESPEPGPDVDPQGRSPVLAFTADGRFLVFTVYPAKAESDQAKKEKKKAGEAPRQGMGIFDLESATDAPAIKIAGVDRFEIPEEGGSMVVYHKSSSSAPKPEEPTPGADQQRGRTAGQGARASNRQVGSDLVVRDLKTGAERIFPDVLEFALARDGEVLVYATGSKDPGASGVYAAALAKESEPQTLLKGKGKYSKLTWDESQTHLAFLSDRDEADAKTPKFKLYGWRRGAPTADEWVSPTTPGFKSGFAPSDRGNITFSVDSGKVFFGCAKPEEIPTPAEGETPEERVVADLWHWKDGFIQPMQKVRAAQERNRTYRAVYHIASKRLVQLADPSMPEAHPSEDGTYIIGLNDQPYRRMVDYDTRYQDMYLVDAFTGTRQPVVRKLSGTPTWAPDGKHILLFDNRHWHTIFVPGNHRINLTGTLGVNFFNELHDTPGAPPAYGNGGWTKDGKYVFLYDQFDIWQVAADGSSARCLTGGLGRRSRTQFRIVRVDRGDPRQRHIDPAKPLLLRAENIETRDSGFWVARAGLYEEPRKLLMGPKNYTALSAARKAEIYLFTASSFAEFPDLMVSDAQFQSVRKISDANPQKAQFRWGTGELIRFQSLDGAPLTAALYKPEGMEPGKKYPMLVYIYERLSQNVHHFVDPRPSHNINASYYVSNGYLVLMPDIVYTTGYPGQSALKCVLPAIQEVVNRGFVNEDAIGIQGHSWGGYQVAYLVTQTTRFKAAAAGAPVANMISAYDGIRWGPGLARQWQYERAQSRIGGSLWQYPSRFIENSPIFMADRVRTPLLMLHNDGDDAVPWYQGIEFFLALRRLGKEVYLLNYNGEPHGLRKRANQKDYTVRLQEFFDHHLKGAPAPAWMKSGVPYLEREKEKHRLEAIYGP